MPTIKDLTAAATKAAQATVKAQAAARLTAAQIAAQRPSPPPLPVVEGHQAPAAGGPAT